MNITDKNRGITLQEQVLSDHGFYREIGVQGSYRELLLNGSVSGFKDRYSRVFGYIMEKSDEAQIAINTRLSSPEKLPDSIDIDKLYELENFALSLIEAIELKKRKEAEAIRTYPVPENTMPYIYFGDNLRV